MKSREQVAEQDKIRGDAIPRMGRNREAGLHYCRRGLTHGTAVRKGFATSFVSNIKGVKRTLQKRPLLALHQCAQPRWMPMEYFPGMSTQQVAAVL